MGIDGSQLGEWLRLLPEVRQEWLDVHACTAPADRYEAEFGIALAYETAGLAPPRTVLWLPDPTLGAVVAAVLAAHTTRVSSRVWTEARHRARRAIGNSHTTRAWRRATEATRFPENDRVDAAIRSSALGLAFTTRSVRDPGLDDSLVAHATTPPSQWRMEAIRAKASMTAWGQYAFWSHDSLGQRRHGHQIAMEALAPDPHRTPTHTPTQKAACD